MRRVSFQLALVCLTLLATPAAGQRAFDVDILADTFGFDRKTRRAVSLRDLHQGCPVRDCIPAIDQPRFVAADQATHVADEALVIAISFNGDKRAYPARILDRHEIVNDTIGGEPIAITWCPLCGSAVGIRRIVAGEVTEFGVSGLLYNSDLVLYDRTTQTLWDQIEATGIVGPLTGEKLELVPVTMTRWSRWRAAHPDTLVLSAETGYAMDYSQDPYAKYRESDRLMFPVARTSRKIRPKTVVYGFLVDDRAIAFSAELLANRTPYTYDWDGVELTVTANEDGSIIMTTAGGEYAPIRLYWFAWYTFHPRTELVHRARGNR